MIHRLIFPAHHHLLSQVAYEGLLQGLAYAWHVEDTHRLATMYDYLAHDDDHRVAMYGVRLWRFYSGVERRGYE